MVGIVVTLFFMSWVVVYAYQTYSKEQEKTSVLLCMDNFIAGVKFARSPIRDFETAEMIVKKARDYCEEDKEK